MSRFLENKNGVLILATGLLLLMFGLAVHSLTQKSPTFDEQGYLTRGLGYVRGENRHMRVGHPLGLNGLSAIFLVGDETVKLPTDDPSWQGTSFHRPSELFLWEIGNDVAHVMFLARLPTVFLGLLLAALVGRWAWEMGGKRPLAGLFALILIALDPNILAHSRLTTTDLGLTTAALMSGYLLWRYFKRPSWQRAMAFGVAFGLLQNTKFTAGLFVPLFALVIGVGVLLYVSRERDLWRKRIRIAIWPLLIVFPLTAFLTLWAAYGFDISPLPETMPTFSQLGGRTVPLAHHLEQLFDIGGRIQKTTPAFLLGRYSETGWWYYFPITFLLKTPLPVLLLIGWAAIVTVRGWLKRQGDGLGVFELAALFIPAVGFFAIALTSEINIGYRHILPVLPFLIVFVSAVLVPAVERINVRRYGLLLAAVWLAVATLWISPDFLAFFNIIAGGPDNGWRLLVDSNLDWGQDLQNLKGWLDENEVNEVWLSYFGEARPDYYGINYRGLESNPPRLMNPLARPFYPPDPAPGIYAISATTLQGVHFENHDLFAWFQSQEPLAKVGYSIFLYEVVAKSDPVDVALGNIQLDEIETADFNQLGTNNIVPRWFDPTIAVPVMGSGEGTVITSKGMTFPEPLAGLFETIYQPVYEGDSVSMARSTVDFDSIEWQAVDSAVFSQGAGQIEFSGFSLPETQLAPDGSLVVLTLSEQLADPGPVKMFLHLTAPDGEIAAQWDGLGIVWQSWLTGDGLIQQHILPLPPSLPHGQFTLWVGYYHPDSAVRWQAIDGAGESVDRIPIEVLTFQ